MRLKAIYNSIEDIPEQYRDLYSERNGQYELTGIEGVKTEADVDRVRVGASKEREAHSETKAKLKVYTDAFGDRPVEEITADLDRIPELEATGGTGEVDQTKIDALVDARVRKEIAPLERENKKLTEQNTELTTENTTLKTKETSRTIREGLRTAATDAKMQASAVDDLLMYETLFELDDEGKPIMKDGVGYTPGIPPEAWIGDMKDKRPHWWGPSAGGGAGGGNGMGSGGENPWSHKHWNLTKQGEMINADRGKAEAMAKSAGSSIGGRRPPAPSS